MAVIHVFRYLAIAFILNANIICGSITKNYLRSNDPISLFDLLQGNNVNAKMIDSNEAEDLVKSIVKHNRINNDKPNMIPINKIITPDYELEKDKINEGVVKSYVTDLLANLLIGNSKDDGIIPPDSELVRRFPNKNGGRFKKSLFKPMPPVYGLVKNRDIPPDYVLVRQGKLQGLIPPDYELTKNRDIQSDYELGKNRDIPPDYELNIKGLIPPDYELTKNKDIPLDYKFVRHGKLNGLIPPDYELTKKRDLSPDYELKMKGLIPPDYELVKTRDIPPDYELVRHGKLQELIPPDYELAKNRDASLDCENFMKGLRIPRHYELLRDSNYNPQYYCKLVRDDKIKSILPADYQLVTIDNDEGSALNKILVKGLVQSNYESPLIDYDHNNNAYFKPNIRLPNRHLINDESDEDLIFVRSPSAEDLSSKGLFDQRYIHKMKEYPKQYRPMTPKEEKMAINLVKHIKHLVTESKSPILKRLALDRILDVLNKMENLRQGEGQPNVEVEPEKTVNPPPLSAYVPFFNYWTYQKTIVEDECPEESVKIGNICSRTPPH